MSEVNSRYYPAPEPVEPEEQKVDLTKLTIKELKAVADEKGIDIEGLLKKAEIIEAIEGKEEEEEEEEEE